MAKHSMRRLISLSGAFLLWLCLMSITPAVADDLYGKLDVK